MHCALLINVDIEYKRQLFIPNSTIYKEKGVGFLLVLVYTSTFTHLGKGDPYAYMAANFQYVAKEKISRKKEIPTKTHTFNAKRTWFNLS